MTSSQASSLHSKSPSTKSLTPDHLAEHIPTCTICLAPYDNRVYVSPCMHSFCATCLSSWLDVGKVCPLCKTAPAKLHWGVDSDRGILNTIYIVPVDSQSSTVTCSHSNSSRLDLGSGGRSWIEELRRVATMPRSGFGRIMPRTPTSENVGSAEQGEIGAEDDDHDDYQEEDGQRPSSARSRSSSRSKSRSRSVTPIDSYHYYYNDDDNDNDNSIVSYRLSKRPRTASPSSLPPSGSFSDTRQLSTPSSSSQPAQPKRTFYSRRDIYLHRLEPTIPTENISDLSLAEQILPTDLDFLRPFMERDLAVLTDTSYHGEEGGEGHVDKMVLEHVMNVFRLHASNNNNNNNGSKRQASKSKDGKQRTATATVAATATATAGAVVVDWTVVELEVAQWVMMLPSISTNSSQARKEELDNERKRWEQELSELFVREMRRFVKRRWKMEIWDERVEYREPVL